MTNYVNKFYRQIENAISALDFSDSPRELYDPLRYSLSTGGKRIRPLLLFLSNDLLGGNSKDAIPAALAVELFHNFTLVHDDIMDNAPLRRNKPTVYKKWNRNIAILSGDAMLVCAYSLLNRSPEKYTHQVFEAFSKGALDVCEGQQLDMNYESKDNVSIAEYIAMIELKTAALIATGLKMGALLASAPPKEVNNFYQFGKNLGIAFQLQDDFLDIFGDPDKFGKKQGGDILANKKTLLFLKTYELMDSKTRKKFISLLQSSTISPSDKIRTAIKMIVETGADKYVKYEVEHYFNKSLRCFDKIKADPGKKHLMRSFVESLIHREL